MKHCYSNLYAFGVSENLPGWEWSKAELLKNIVGFHNIADLLRDKSNMPSVKHLEISEVRKHGKNAHDKTSAHLSKILEEDVSSADSNDKKNDDAPLHIKFVSIHAGESFCFLETKEHFLCGFGYNHNNILGINSNLEKTGKICEPVHRFDDKIINLTFSNEHTIIHLANGKSYCWG